MIMDFSKILYDVETLSVTEYFCKLRKKKFGELSIEELRTLAVTYYVELPHSVINCYFWDYENSNTKRKGSEHIDALFELKYTLPKFTATVALDYLSKKRQKK